MIKKFSLLLAVFLFSFIDAETIDIDVPDVKLIESGGYVVPKI